MNPSCASIKCQSLDIRENQDLRAEDASFYLGSCFSFSFLFFSFFYETENSVYVDPLKIIFLWCDFAFSEHFLILLYF